MLYIKPSDFLRDKIIELKTAVLHRPEDHFFNLQSVVAQTLGLDDDGILWMATEKPVDCADHSKESFDIVLNYHKEGRLYDLDILGDASVINVEDGENLPGYAKNAFNKGKIVLRVQLLDIDYWEEKTSLFKSLSQKLHHIFSDSTEHTNDQQVYHDHRMSA